MINNKRQILGSDVLRSLQSPNNYLMGLLELLQFVQQLRPNEFLQNQQFLYEALDCVQKYRSNAGKDQLDCFMVVVKNSLSNMFGINSHAYNYMCNVLNVLGYGNGENQFNFMDNNLIISSNNNSSLSHPNPLPISSSNITTKLQQSPHNSSPSKAGQHIIQQQSAIATGAIIDLNLSSNQSFNNANCCIINPNESNHSIISTNSPQKLNHSSINNSKLDTNIPISRDNNSDNNINAVSMTLPPMAPNNVNLSNITPQMNTSIQYIPQNYQTIRQPQIIPIINNDDINFQPRFLHHPSNNFNNNRPNSNIIFLPQQNNTLQQSNNNPTGQILLPPSQSQIRLQPNIQGSYILNNNVPPAGTNIIPSSNIHFQPQQQLRLSRQQFIPNTPIMLSPMSNLRQQQSSNNNSVNHMIGTPVTPGSTSIIPNSQQPIFYLPQQQIHPHTIMPQMINMEQNEFLNLLQHHHSINNSTMTNIIGPNPNNPMYISGCNNNITQNTQQLPQHIINNNNIRGPINDNVIPFINPQIIPVQMMSGNNGAGVVANNLGVTNIPHFIPQQHLRPMVYNPNMSSNTTPVEVSSLNNKISNQNIHSTVNLSRPISDSNKPGTVHYHPSKQIIDDQNIDTNNFNTSPIKQQDLLNAKESDNISSPTTHTTINTHDNSPSRILQHSPHPSNNNDVVDVYVAPSTIRLCNSLPENDSSPAERLFQSAINTIQKDVIIVSSIPKSTFLEVIARRKNQDRCFKAVQNFAIRDSIFDPVYSRDHIEIQMKCLDHTNSVNRWPSKFFIKLNGHIIENVIRDQILGDECLFIKNKLNRYDNTLEIECIVNGDNTLPPNQPDEESPLSFKFLINLVLRSNLSVMLRAIVNKRTQSIDKCREFISTCFNENPMDFTRGYIIVPMYDFWSSSPIIIPVRGENCKHIQCYDFESLCVKHTKRTHFICPICGILGSLQTVIIDGFLCDIIYNAMTNHLNISDVKITPEFTYTYIQRSPTPSIHNEILSQTNTTNNNTTAHKRKSDYDISDEDLYKIFGSQTIKQHMTNNSNIISPSNQSPNLQIFSQQNDQLISGTSNISSTHQMHSIITQPTVANTTTANSKKSINVTKSPKKLQFDSKNTTKLNTTKNQAMNEYKLPISTKFNNFYQLSNDDIILSDINLSLNHTNNPILSSNTDDPNIYNNRSSPSRTLWESVDDDFFKDLNDSRSARFDPSLPSTNTLTSSQKQQLYSDQFHSGSNHD